MHLHGAIRSALQGFAKDVSGLQANPEGVNAAQLAALLERHRFLRAVCTFHAASEDEVLFPAARYCFNHSPRVRAAPVEASFCLLDIRCQCRS